jgi:extradiol dioxygenase family protein
LSSSSKTPWVANIPIVVSDREAAKKWYTEKLGLLLIANDDHWVTVGGKDKGSALHLCMASENMPKPIPLEPGPSGIVIVLPGDFRAECKRLMDAGVEFSHPPEMLRGDGSRRSGILTETSTISHQLTIERCQ